MMVMVTCPEWISGKESYIDCMHGGSIPDEVINSYCWIKGTFIVPIHYKDFNTEVGWDVSQTGVGPYNPGTTEIEVKAYYQWVPFVLFLQGMMFYLPHIIFKTVEEGKPFKLPCEAPDGWPKPNIYWMIQVSSYFNKVQAFKLGK